uniref:SPRY domain-containing protein n=1 Tax=Globodera pallida TaxID=36090 RepID=A0A183BT29_GLOPA
MFSEKLGPTSTNLDPSVKKRLLLAWSQLGSQLMDLPTSSDGFDFLTYDVNHLSLSPTELRAKDELHQMKEELKNTEELVGKKFEQMEESLAKLALENKELRAEHEKLSLSNANKFAELKEYQNKQQKAIDDLTEKLKRANNIRGMDHKQKNYQEGLQRNRDKSLKSGRAMVGAKLVKQKQSNANKFEEIEQKNDKLEKSQKEEQLNIVHPQKTVTTMREIGQTPQQNRWDFAACHVNLALSEPDRLIVQHNDDKWEWSSVRAERPLLPENPYFEVEVLEKTWTIRSWSAFWRGESERRLPAFPRNLCFGTKPEFGVGDVVGCGINFKNHRHDIIYTKNGKRLDTWGLVADSASDLFPCVSLRLRGTKIKVNFGPNFKYNIADVI